MHISPITAAAADLALPSSAELALTLLGPSTSMSQLWAQMRRLAPHVRTLLLTGAPDCGQEAVARLLLDLSPQPHRLFLMLPAAKAEERLAGAQAPSSLPPEIFLYLPDADRLSATAQDAVLRLIRSRRPQAVTVVAAASDHLRTLVSMGRFCPELAELLSAVRLAVPALKERVEDLPMLLHQMLTLRCQAKRRSTPQISEPVLRAAMGHGWSGNLRELSDTVDELLKGNDAKAELEILDWTRAMNAGRIPKVKPADVRMIRLDAVMQEHIYSVLGACSGNKQRAAEVLGISRSKLYRMLEEAAENAPLSLAS